MPRPIQEDHTALPVRSPPEPQSPQSPRTQRRLLRESEDSGGEMSIEQYLYCTDPFRSISISNPSPKPLEVEYLSIEEDPTRDFHHEIRSVLERHNFPSVSLFHAVKTTVDDKSIHLLRAAASGDGSTAIPLEPVKDDLIYLLRQHGLSEMEVEVINADHFHRPAFFHISTADQLVMAYEQTKHEITRLLDRYLGAKWQLISPFNIGRGTQKEQPAIVMFVNFSTKSNWSELRTQIMNLIASNLPLALAEVEFLPGSLNLLPTNKAVSFRDRMNTTGDPEMGHSIGIRGENGAGTLGGYVTLTHDGETYRGLLTNYHVVRPSLPSDFLEAFDHFGISFTSPPAHRTAITVESLAQMDRDWTIVDIDHQLASLETQKATIASYIEKKLLVGEEPSAASQQKLETLEICKAGLLNTRLFIEPMPYVLGDVLLASGHSILGNRAMDWAVVRLTTEAENRFFKPNRMCEIPRTQKPKNSPDNETASFVLQQGTPLVGFGSLQEGRYCVKKGRTTDVTGGVCNGPKSCCNWSSCPVRYDSDGNAIDTQTARTEEFVILGNHGSFAEPGDSGSFILDEDGAVAGLLFAEVGDGSNLVTVAMSMADVVESIKLKATGSVSISLAS
ncbi:hypothetical protein N7475_003093 [Penicillium sp. IBT 31633x]|nr:hypothetical protein N7475_003093 [Penicillium sp. IBT 31633x]